MTWAPAAPARAWPWATGHSPRVAHGVCMRVWLLCAFGSVGSSWMATARRALIRAALDLCQGLLQNKITRFGLVKFMFMLCYVVLLSNNGEGGWRALGTFTWPRPPCVWIHLYRPLGQYMAIFRPYYGSWKILEQMLLYINPACKFACRFSLTSLRDCHLRC